MHGFGCSCRLTAPSILIRTFLSFHALLNESRRRRLAATCPSFAFGDVGTTLEVVQKRRLILKAFLLTAPLQCTHHPSISKTDPQLDEIYAPSFASTVSEPRKSAIPEIYNRIFLTTKQFRYVHTENDRSFMLSCVLKIHSVIPSSDKSSISYTLCVPPISQLK